MRRISSSLTFFLKFVTPFPALVFMVVWFGIAFSAIDLAKMWWFLLCGAAAFVLAGYAFYRFVWSLADEVLDGGDHLLVRRRGLLEQVRLQDIINVSFERGQNVKRAVLRLARPGPLGDRITFVPAMNFRFSLFGDDPMEEDLIRRVDSARRTG